MKDIAILRYSIMFDPSEAWSSGVQFESDLAKCFKQFGFEADIIESRGGTGERVIFLRPINTPQQVAQRVPQPKDGKPASEQIKNVQSQVPTKSFKQYQERGVPKSIVNQEKRQPKPSFGGLGRTLRKKVRMP